MLIDDVSRDLYEKVRQWLRKGYSLQRSDVVVYMSDECFDEVIALSRQDAYDLYMHGVLLGYKVFVVRGEGHPDYRIVNLKECK